MKPSDVVQLKSGGPFMTIIETRGDAHAKCEWFGLHGRRLKRAWFTTANLNAVPKEQV